MKITNLYYWYRNVTKQGGGLLLRLSQGYSTYKVEGSNEIIVPMHCG